MASLISAANIRNDARNDPGIEEGAREREAASTGKQLGRGVAPRPRIDAYGQIPRALMAVATRSMARMYAPVRMSTLYFLAVL